MPISGEKKVLVGMTEILHSRLQKWSKGNAMSMSEALAEGARLLLDGPPEVAVVESHINKVATERLGPDPKIGFGASVEAFLAKIPATSVPEEPRESLPGESEDETEWRKKCAAKFRREIYNIPKVHRKAWASMSWEQRYEWLADKKERGE